ncbi:MAG: DUF1800 domain-containing protein [Vicinamibacterales bacterium]
MVEHVLSRLTFGPRPGELAAVERIGLDRWVAQQLQPQGPVAALTPPPRFDSQQEARRFAREQLRAMAAAKLQRAVSAERQLEELLVDLWFNHFNVFGGKAQAGLHLPAYEWQAIRPHVVGRFRDLLGAVAKSPAMLIYLDNRQSTVRGLNENYARELLELHTLGADGGYTQADVREVARVFTGWTLDRQTQAFRFAPRLHDTGTKQVLGERIAAAGMAEGERILDRLASHPSTARTVAIRLARRFVADDPPPGLVDRAATTFRETGGNLHEVTRVVITSAEFTASAGMKVKTPLEFVASALRATGATFDSVETAARPVRLLQQLGMPLYLCQPPTGYDDTAGAWLAAGGLVTRMNAAIAFGHPEFGLPAFQRR